MCIKIYVTHTYYLVKYNNYTFHNIVILIKVFAVQLDDRFDNNGNQLVIVINFRKEVQCIVLCL